MTWLKLPYNLGRNVIIVLLPYFAARLSLSSITLGASVSSLVPLVYTAGNLFFLVRATFAQAHSGNAKDLEKRITIAVPALAGVIALLLLSTFLQNVGQQV